MLSMLNVRPLFSPPVIFRRMPFSTNATHKAAFSNLPSAQAFTAMTPSSSLTCRTETLTLAGFFNTQLMAP